jgi:hypothetical protein
LPDFRPSTTVYPLPIKPLNNAPMFPDPAEFTGLCIIASIPLIGDLGIAAFPCIFNFDTAVEAEGGFEISC